VVFLAEKAFMAARRDTNPHSGFGAVHPYLVAGHKFRFID
jgi:hypothetical protein